MLCTLIHYRFFYFFVQIWESLFDYVYTISGSSNTYNFLRITVSTVSIIYKNFFKVVQTSPHLTIILSVING